MKIIDAHSHNFQENSKIFPFINSASAKDWQKLQKIDFPCVKFYGSLVPEFSILELAKILEADPNACIGEIGLDKSQLELAEKYERPVSIHCVHEWPKFFELLENFQIPSIMLHGFYASKEILERLIKHKQNIYISYSYKALNFSKTKELVALTPRNKILIETDSENGEGLIETYAKLGVSYEQVEKNAKEFLQNRTFNW